MEETKIFSLEAISSISELRDLIKDLKKEVDSAKVGSDAYKTATQNLAEAQRALKLAQTGVYNSMTDIANASKMDADAINKTTAAAKAGTATYNQMSTALSALKQQIKDIPKYLTEEDQALGKVNAAYTEANEKIQVLDTSLKSLDADNGVFGRNVGNYLGALEQWGGTMGRVGEIGSQLATGVLSLVGILSLFGVETEDTKEALKAVIPVVGILQAGKGIGGLAKVITTATAGQKALAGATATAAAASAADATAKGTETVATEAATVAQEGLNKSMLANPILAIVAGLIALVTAVAAYVKGANKAAKETKEWANQEQNLNDKFDVQNTALERSQRISAAQGATNRELLSEKKQLVIAQKNETEAMLKNIEARIAQMKADSAWVRFWKGENKAIKNLEEQAKNLTETIKGFNNTITDLNIDIQVEDINTAKTKVKQYADTLKDDVKNALSIANTAINSQKDSMTTLNDEYEENDKLLRKGLTSAQAQLKKQKENSAAWVQTLENISVIERGILANQARYDAAVSNSKAVDYTRAVASAYTDIVYDIEKLTGKQTELENIIETVLGFSDGYAGFLTTIQEAVNEGRQISDEEIVQSFLQGSTALNNLVQGYKELGRIIGDDIKALTNFDGEIENLSVDGLDWAKLVELSQTDADRLAARVGEPLATAIGKWVENSGKLDDAKLKLWTEITAAGSTRIDDEIAKNNPELARLFADELKEKLFEMVGNDEAARGLVGHFINNFYRKIDKSIAENPYSTEFAKKWGGIFQVDGIRNSFDAITYIARDFLDTYVESTAGALDAVASLWDESLKARYKRMVEVDKMSEEEAQAQAERGFKWVKAMQYGVAVVDTAAAVTQALADPTIPSYYVKIANAAAALATGTAQIISIANTEFGTPNVKIPETQTPSYSPQPSEMVYTYGLNAADYAAAAAQNPIKAYVVDSDLAAGMDNYDQRQNETTW